MYFVKLETSDSEARWINLEQVCRVTVATQSSGAPILAIYFSDGDRDASFKIEGSDEINRKAIDHLVSHLDSLKK